MLLLGPGLPEKSTTTELNTLKAEMLLIISTRPMVGESSGTVMRKKIRLARAPSTLATV